MSNDYSISDDVYELLKEDLLCDVTLIAAVDGKKFPAHRVILSAASGYFRGIFTSECEERDKTEVKIENVAGDVLEKAIECCYTGRIEINDDNIESLLYPASFFQFPLLEENCADYLLNQGKISTNNCVGIWTLAKRYKLKNIKAGATVVLFERFLKASKCEQFYQLRKTDLKEILEDDEIIVDSEEDVLNALVGWVKFNPDERRHDFPDLLEAVRLDQLEDSFVHQEVQAICDEFECADTYLKLTKLRSLNLEANIQSGRRSTMLSNFIVLTTGNETLRILKYSHSLNEWAILLEKPQERLVYAAAIVDMNLYMIGGFSSYNWDWNEDEIPNEAHVCIDLKTLEKITLQPMPTSRKCLCIEEDGDFIYAAGGFNLFEVLEEHFTALNTVERYDVKSDEWTELAPLLEARYFAASANLLGTIYVIGGETDETELNSVEKYDPMKNEWSLVALMILERSRATAGVANGCIYVYQGGYNSTIEQYDPLCDEWSLLTFQIGVPRDVSYSVRSGWIFWGGESNTFGKQSLITEQTVELSPMLDRLNEYTAVLWASPATRLDVPTPITHLIDTDINDAGSADLNAMAQLNINVE